MIKGVQEIMSIVVSGGTHIIVVIAEKISKRKSSQTGSFSNDDGAGKKNVT